MNFINSLKTEWVSPLAFLSFILLSALILVLIIALLYFQIMPTDVMK